MTEQDAEIIALTDELLTAITSADWQSYQRLCADDLTAFEPEAEQHLVVGLGFHRHYFGMADKSPYVDVNTTISSPHVRHMGDVAVIAYVRLTQRVTDGISHTTATPETRVWQMQAGCWKHIHFHRS